MISLKELPRDQEGTAAIEYALVAGVLCCAVLAGSMALREPAAEMYDRLAQAKSAFAIEPAAGPWPKMPDPSTQSKRSVTVFFE